MLNEIESKFLNMVKKKKVDLSVLPILEKYKKSVSKLKSNFLKEKRILEKFHYLYSLDVQLRVIETLFNRVRVARGINDNPKVARDALTVIPFMKRIDIETRGKEFKNMGNLELGSDLQIVALKSAMYPESKEVLNEADKSQIRKDFYLFSQRIH